MKIYDFYFVLDKNQVMLRTEWGNPRSEDMYRLLFSNWILRGEKPSGVFPMADEDQDGELFWDEDHFTFEKIKVSKERYYLFFKKRNDQEYLFAKTLDHISDGIQIYDKNACAVFFNKASREIAHIPSDVSIEGRYLLDMYNLDENISTIMTCLRTQSPVTNRTGYRLPRRTRPIRSGKERRF